MAEPEEPAGRVPENWRENNYRPIIIYQGEPPSLGTTPINNALGFMFWLLVLTVCAGIAAFCAWSLWKPDHDVKQYSPIYVDGRPTGLNGQLEERRQVNAWADRLTDYLDRIRDFNDSHRYTTLQHPLFANRQSLDLEQQGIDSLRQQWDGMCNDIRARIYDRRIGAFDGRAAIARQRLAVARDPAERAQINAELTDLTKQRDAILDQRRADVDPALRCTPAALSTPCDPSSDEPWCNPQLARPEEFSDEDASTSP